MTTKLKPSEISNILKTQLADFDKRSDTYEIGTVLSVGDGIARVYGLSNVMSGELVEFQGGIRGMALNLEDDNVGIAIFGEDTHIKEGDPVKRTKRITNAYSSFTH